MRWTIVVAAMLVAAPAAAQPDVALKVKQCQRAAADMVDKMGARLVKVSVNPKDSGTGGHITTIEIEMAGQPGVLSGICVPSATDRPARILDVFLTK